MKTKISSENFINPTARKKKINKVVEITTQIL